jgi:hypothetical protein
MTLFFNLEILEQQSNNDPNKFMAMLEYHYTKRLPSKYAKYKPSRRPLHGTSFILNFDELLQDKSTDILYKIQYIKLLARRDYSLYKLYKIRTLQLSFFPDVKLDQIQHNPLLTITPNEIKFKYEEV